jgi:hypothetical protein
MKLKRDTICVEKGNIRMCYYEIVMRFCSQKNSTFLLYGYSSLCYAVVVFDKKNVVTEPENLS